MAEKILKRLLPSEIHMPTLCKQCGGVMIYKGLGEYECEECGLLDYDDYGKVRNYLEKHRGANVAEISDFTGVSHKSIRDMIKDKRFEIIDNRGGYLRCEMCGINISSGRLCPQCEEKYHRSLEEQARLEKKKDFTGYGGDGNYGEEGSTRFKRQK